MRRSLKFLPRLTQIGQWISLFLVLLLAIYAATQSRDAPLLILFTALYAILANFSIPVPPTRIGFGPVVAVASLLVLSWQSALLALAVGLALAELTVPLWRPLWQDIPDYPQQPRPRLGGGLVLVLALTLTGLTGSWPAAANDLAGRFVDELFSPAFWLPFLILSSTFFAIYAAAHLLLARLLGQSWEGIVDQHFPRLIVFGLLPQPLAWLAAMLYRVLGLPVLIVTALAAVAVGLQLWFSWQSRYILRRQRRQFALLNRVSHQLRETLDLEKVLVRTYEQVSTVLPLDRFAIILCAEDGSCRRPLLAVAGRVETAQPGADAYQPEDFVCWVLEHGRSLEVDGGTLHYADQHRLMLPEPTPTLWLGLPLFRGSAVSGVMVIHQTTPGRIVDRWSRELLVAIARQASDAIENARQHRETLRLYSLTDEALTRRARQLQAILNSTREGFLLLDMNGRVVLANAVADQFLQLLNPAGGDMLSTQAAVEQLGYTPAQLDALLARLRQDEVPEGETRLLRVGVPDSADEQEIRYLERVEAPVWGEAERPLGWLIVLRDVTEQQERVAWRTQFTHMVVHDLRNPITTLLSGFERLELAQTGRGPSPHLVDDLIRSGRRVTTNMLDMVDSLMDIARMEAGQIVADSEAMRLPPLVRRVVTDMLSLAFAKQIELTVTMPDGLPAIWGDEELTRRVLVNLLDNALKFTPAGGRINGFLGEEPAVDGAHEPGVRFTLVDTGPGIPDAARKQIFERFVRIDTGGGQVRGTGIGLAFCKMAVEAQGGSIWVEEPPEKGSCFVFTLPGIPHFDRLA